MSRSSSRRDSTRSEQGSFWRADLSSLTGRRASTSKDEPVERPAFTPTLPQVNLLPRSVRDAVLTAKIRRAFVALLALVLVASAALWYLQSDRIHAAENAVDAATSTNERVRADLEAMAPVRQMYEQITRLQGVVTDTLASQPRAAVIVSELLAAGEQAAGRNVTFTSIDVVYSGTPGTGDQLNPCPNPDPFTTEITIGCLTFSASVATREQVADLLRALEENPLFVGPYVTTSTVSAVEGDADTVTFTGSAGISTAGLVTPLSDEEIAAIVTPPAETSGTEEQPSTDGATAGTDQGAAS